MKTLLLLTILSFFAAPSICDAAVYTFRGDINGVAKVPQGSSIIKGDVFFGSFEIDDKTNKLVRFEYTAGKYRLEMDDFDSFHEVVVSVDDDVVSIFASEFSDEDGNFNILRLVMGEDGNMFSHEADMLNGEALELEISALLDKDTMLAAKDSKPVPLTGSMLFAAGGTLFLAFLRRRAR